MEWTSWTDWLALAGGVLQCFGLWLIVLEIVRTENRTFPERQHRARRALDRLRAPTRRGNSPSQWCPPTCSPAYRRWRERVTQLHGEQQVAMDALRDRMTKSDDLLGQRIANLANDVNAARDEDRAALDESLARQKLYTGMFVVGTLLATLASVYA